MKTESETTEGFIRLVLSRIWYVFVLPLSDATTPDWWVPSSHRRTRCTHWQSDSDVPRGVEHAQDELMRSVLHLRVLCEAVHALARNTPLPSQLSQQRIYRPTDRSKRPKLCPMSFSRRRAESKELIPTRVVSPPPPPASTAHQAVAHVCESSAPQPIPFIRSGLCHLKAEDGRHRSQAIQPINSERDARHRQRSVTACGSAVGSRHDVDVCARVGSAAPAQ